MLLINSMFLSCSFCTGIRCSMRQDVDVVFSMLRTEMLRDRMLFSLYAQDKDLNAGVYALKIL